MQKDDFQISVWSFIIDHVLLEWEGEFSLNAIVTNKKIMVDILSYFRALDIVKDIKQESLLSW